MQHDREVRARLGCRGADVAGGAGKCSHVPGRAINGDKCRRHPWLKEV